MLDPSATIMAVRHPQTISKFKRVATNTIESSIAQQTMDWSQKRNWVRKMELNGNVYGTHLVA